MQSCFQEKKRQKKKDEMKKVIKNQKKVIEKQAKKIEKLTQMLKKRGKSANWNISFVIKVKVR